MIKVIKYSEIDFEKYEKCLENACQNSDFADKDFLDIVSESYWFLLVYNDYEAIMPISYLKKFGLNFVLMPKFCRQLGIFSASDNIKVNDLFYDFLNKNFLVLDYSFNSENQFSKTLEKKTSYIIKKNNYEEVKSNYSKNRKRNVRIPDDLVKEVIFKTQLNIKVLAFFIKNVKGTKNDYESMVFYGIISKLLNQNIGKFKILQFGWDMQSLVYLYEGKRNFYLSALVNSDNLVNPNIPSLMIDQCLKETIETKNFDFAGSDIENVAKFNERFGAKSYQYSVFADNKFTLIKKLLTNYRIISNFAL